jgi:transcription initiation factor TFIIE subunit alpha
MKLNQDKIDRLVEEIAGPDCVELVRLIIKLGKNISEFKLAEELGLIINQVRNMLYRLQKYNLVNSTRKKDKKKGWYIYYWTFNEIQARDLIMNLKEKKISNLRKKLEKETSSKFLTCSKKCLRLKFEDAIEYGFKCPECGNLLKEIDNKKEINSIKKQISLLEKEIETAKAKT